MKSVGETLAGQLSLIGTLPDEDRQALAGLDAEMRELKRHKDILKTGDHPTHVVVVLDGFLTRYTIGPEGQRQIHSFYLPTEAPCLETLYLDYMDNNLGPVVDSTIGLVPTTSSIGSSTNGRRCASSCGARPWSRAPSSANG